MAILSIPVAGVVVLAAAFGQVGLLEELPSVLWAGLLSAAVGLALGVALPTGIRAFALNSTAVAEAWALNGAFSVLGSALAALGGLVIGSRGLLIASAPCYTLALLLVAVSRRSPWPSASRPHRRQSRRVTPLWPDGNCRRLSLLSKATEAASPLGINLLGAMAGGVRVGR